MSHVTYDAQLETLDILSCLMSPRTLLREKTNKQVLLLPSGIPTTS
jgi:hypothetical protein